MKYSSSKRKFYVRSVNADVTCKIKKLKACHSQHTEFHVALGHFSEQDCFSGFKDCLVNTDI